MSSHKATMWFLVYLQPMILITLLTLLALLSLPRSRAQTSSDPVTFPNSQHTLGNQSSAPGTFTLTLAATDTANCGEGANKEILTQCVIAGATTYFRGVNLLTVYGNTPIQ